MEQETTSHHMPDAPAGICATGVWGSGTADAETPKYYWSGGTTNLRFSVRFGNANPCCYKCSDDNYTAETAA